MRGELAGQTGGDFSHAQNLDRINKIYMILMKTKSNPLWFLILLFLSILSPAHADLAVTATPGFVFSDTPSGRPTVANLNRALQMTYAISGSIGGTNAGLAAKSVSGTMLMDSVVDNVTLEYDGSSPRAIEIKDAGVGIDELGSVVAGLGLGGGSGAALSNKTDNVTITITNDVITLMTNLPATHLNVASNGVVVGTSTNRGQTVDLQVFAAMLSTNEFASVTTALNGIAAGKSLDVAHGFTRTPHLVKGVIVCTATDAGYAIGDEVDFQSVFDASAPESTDHRGANGITAAANSTNVFVVQAASNVLTVRSKSTGFGVNMDESKWSFRVYARP